MFGTRIAARCASTFVRSSAVRSSAVRSSAVRSSASQIPKSPFVSDISINRGSRMALSGLSAALTQQQAPIVQQKRTMFDWALRPYAYHVAANSGLSLATLNAGFSKCSLSLLVCPWKALPTALVILPLAYLVPAAYRMVFSNCSRGATASVFQGFMQFTLTFLPVPAFENLFAELTFYITALFLTFFMYNLFPELMLEDSIWIFYAALFVMPMLPLAFSYMPLFATRTYLIL